MKTLKRIFLCIICVLMLISVCSCDYIEELKETSARRLENGNIEFDGHVYIRHDTNTHDVYEIDTCERLNLCLEDEPILWPQLMGGVGRRWDFNFINDQKTVISSDIGSKFYIREDVYSDVANELAELDKGNCIVTFDDYRIKDGQIKFSVDDSKALWDTMKQPPVSFDDYGDYNGSFYRYSLNGTFYEYAALSLAERDGKYYIVDEKYGEAYQASGRAEKILKDIMVQIVNYDNLAEC